jgi:parallel beta-helix repeat protein
MKNRKLSMIMVSIVLLIAFVMPSMNGTRVTQEISPMLIATPVHNINTHLNYTTIQAAIDAPETLDGHTLRCDAGNYTEVKVYKSLKIIGAGPSVCWIIPFEPDDGIYDNANNVTISGFTIKSVSGYSAVRLNGVSHCYISDNVITGNGFGISLRSSNENTISSNDVYSLPSNGISIADSSQRNTLVGNNLNRNHYGIIVSNASNYNVISDNFVNSSDWDGIRLNWLEAGFSHVVSNNITNNVVSHGYDGIFLDYPSSSNVVSSNFASHNTNGIRLRQASNTTITHNTVTSNTYGIYAENSANNRIYDNFLSNTNNAWDNGANSWNITKRTGPNMIGGPYIGGNYWSDNPKPVDANHDGLGDMPYNITGGVNKDYLPLVGRVNIAVTNVTSKTVVDQGYSLKINVTAANQGDYTETFNVTAYYNEPAILTPEQWPTPEQSKNFSMLGDVDRDGYIDDYDVNVISCAMNTTPGDPRWNPHADLHQDGRVNVLDMVICTGHYGLNAWSYFGLSALLKNQTVVTLPAGNSTGVIFRWNTAGFAKGNYTIRAYATPVPGETDTADNTLKAPAPVEITIPGDVDGNHVVDIVDVVKITSIYATNQGDPKFMGFSPNCDIDNDGKITMLDLVICTSHYAQKDP